MIPLAVANPGDKVNVVRVGGNEEGFVPGAEVSVVSAPGDGNVIVNLKGAKLAITSQMATRIMINQERD